MKRTKEQKDKESLDFILESRLEMQSVRRYLDANKVPANSKYLKSSQFKEQFYSKWPEFKKRDFLQTLAGTQWKTMQEIIENE